MSEDKDDNVVKFNKNRNLNQTLEGTEDDIDADLVLKAAVGNMDDVIVAGWKKDGSFYLAMSQGAISDNLMILESARLVLNTHMMPYE
jgi:hypothetical protein